MNLISRKRNYSLLEGYLTIPQASKLIAAKIGKKNNKSVERRYYKIMLEGAKRKKYGAIKYGTKMFQIKESEVNNFIDKEIKKLGISDTVVKYDAIVNNVEKIIKLDAKNGVNPEVTVVTILKEIIAGI
jgi:hypothetical protein